MRVCGNLPTRGALPELRWYWSFFAAVNKPAEMVTNGRAPTLEAAKVQFNENWRRWLAWTALTDKQPHDALLENYREVTQASSFSNRPTFVVKRGVYGKAPRARLPRSSR